MDTEFELSNSPDIKENDPMRVVKEAYIEYMKNMEKQLKEDIRNAMVFDRRYSYLLGRGQIYTGICPCRKNNFELKPDNAIHIIISNNIYSVWFEAQRVIKYTCKIDLLDDFITYYNSQYKPIESVGCFGRKKRVNQSPISIKELIDKYILQFQLEREDGFYVIRTPISVL